MRKAEGRRRRGLGDGAEWALAQELVFRASPRLHRFFSFPLTNYSMRETELFLRATSKLPSRAMQPVNNSNSYHLEALPMCQDAALSAFEAFGGRYWGR